MLIVLSGLPGVGKTTIARELARETGGVHVRVDSIEQALRNAGFDVKGEGYEIAYAVAEDNLRTGRLVVADCVNPLPLTRAAWRDVAERVRVPMLDVEVVCSDADEHRRRVETRSSDLRGLRLPAWSEIVARELAPWTSGRHVVDTAYAEVHQSVDAILSALPAVFTIR